MDRAGDDNENLRTADDEWHEEETLTNRVAQELQREELQAEHTKNRLGFAHG